MKKNLLFSAVAFASITANAQVISNDDFNSSSYTVGDLVPAFSPSVGQGGWKFSATGTIPNRATSNVKVAEIGGKKAVTILGVDAAAGSKFLFKDSFLPGWENRTEFNDVIHAEFDFYTGESVANTTNRTSVRFLAPHPTINAQYVALATFGMDHKDLTLLIGGYSNPCDVIKDLCPKGNEYSAGNYSYTYGKLPVNTWYKVGLAWDYSTGEVFLKIINSATGELLVDDSLPGLLANAEIVDIAITNQGLDNGDVAATSTYGSFKLEAKDEVNLLAVNDITKAKVNLTLFPNPASDFLNIESKAKVEAVQVYDMSGKSINSSVLDNKVDVRNLSKGTYIIKVKTTAGETTQKFIKN